MKSKNLSENILRSVRSKGFKYIDLPSVIEANHIVQRSGESFRKFIFSFTDQNGSELCLRPDLTIVSCLRYLENNLKGKEKIFYSGQAYRKSQNKKDSIIRNQIGFEILGSRHEKSDDKEIINTSLKTLKNIKYTSGTLTLGNVEIFSLRDLKTNKIMIYNWGFIKDLVFYSVNTAYDPIFHDFRVGKVMYYEIFKYAFETKKFNRLDCGTGRYPWKFEWTNDFNLLYQLNIDKPRSKYLKKYYMLKTLLKK